jgi:AcrR family transcriptional regulator
MSSDPHTQTESARNKILCAAAEEILSNGFQSASVSSILRKSNVSKGCFYHHFETKQALGLAVLEESFIDIVRQIWEPIFESDDPLASLIALLSGQVKELEQHDVKLGCPINNLAQEMSPIDDAFRQRIELIHQVWKQRLTKALQKSKQNGQMLPTADAKAVATLTIATAQGAIGIAKNSQRKESFFEYTQGLVQYLSSLQIQ